MTPERVAFYAEQAWPAGHEETSVRAIERAITQAVNEAISEISDLASEEILNTEMLTSYPPQNAAIFRLKQRIRALKLPEEP